ncbi:Major facilitator superfamily domain containing protein [Elaphomyces granulatus]
MGTSQEEDTGDVETPPTIPPNQPRDVSVSSSLKKGSEDVSLPPNENGPESALPAMHPQEGMRAWTVVAGAYCALFVSFGWINCIGVFQDYYQLHQLKNLSPSTVSWIPSLESFMMLAGGPIFGRLFDSYGPRWPLLIGSLLHVFGLMMTSISSEYYQFILSQGICSPLGASAVFFVATTSVATWFQKHRALALGITASGSSLAGVIFPIMVERLIPRVGFGWAMRICAFLMFFLLVIANLTIRSRLHHHPRPVHVMDFIRPLGEGAFALTVTAAFLIFWGMFLPFTFVILQAERYNVSAELVPYLIPIMNAASILGRTLPGYVADRVGRFNTMIVMSGFTAVVVLALWIPSRTSATSIIFCILYGFGSGAFISLSPAVVAQISDIRQLGIRSGTFFAVASVAALTGNPIGGALLPNAQTGSYLRLQLFAGIVMLAGSMFFILARGYIAGFNPRKKV